MTFRKLLKESVPDGEERKLLLGLVSKHKIKDLVNLKIFLTEEIKERKESLKKKELRTYMKRRMTQELESLQDCMQLYKRYLE